MVPQIIIFSFVATFSRHFFLGGGGGGWEGGGVRAKGLTVALTDTFSIDLSYLLRIGGPENN